MSFRNTGNLLGSPGESTVRLQRYRLRDPELSLTPQKVMEVREDGAVYLVTERQVQLHTAASKGQQWLGMEEDLLEMVCETVTSRVLKAGTLTLLTHHLLAAFSCGDSSYLSIFLATYRSFSHCSSVLQLLLDRLERLDGGSEQSDQADQDKTTEAASSLLSTWLECYPEDFWDLESSCCQRLSAYIQREFGGQNLERRLHSVLSTRSNPDGGGGERGWSEAGAGPGHRHQDTEGFLTFTAENIAGQLTTIDSELFMHVVPYHCLGSVWSRRDKKGMESVAPTVRATVRHFNRLVECVTSCCLSNTNLRPQQRARILEKWIRVAEECRSLKNFSSLYAIVSALQTNPIHRLRRVWEEVPREYLHTFEELLEIFSEKNNYSQSRELLLKEGTSKFATVEKKKHHKRVRDQKSSGTVPYLGTFLTDLVMLDTAVKDYTEDGLINFDKHRKEFEIMAQIKLLQSACKNYTIERDPEFLAWFYWLQSLPETESYQLSCQIEPLTEINSNSAKFQPTLIVTDWEGDRPDQGGPPLPNDAQNLTQDLTHDHLLSPFCNLLSKVAKHKKWPSVSTLDSVELNPSPPSPPQLPPAGSVPRGHRRSASCGAHTPCSTRPGPLQSDTHIIRVRMDIDNGNMYKSILVSSQDKTRAVVGKALEKHNQDLNEASSWDLVQLMDGQKELTIPHNANVFYAMNSSSVDFLLREKGTGTSTSFPKIKSKGMKSSRTLF